VYAKEDKHKGPELAKEKEFLPWAKRKSWNQHFWQQRTRESRPQHKMKEL
jgi:hypothetical protein